MARRRDHIVMEFLCLSGIQRGITLRRGFKIFVSQQLTHDLVLPGHRVQIKLPGQVPKLVRRQCEARVLINDTFQLLGRVEGCLCFPA